MKRKFSSFLLICFVTVISLTSCAIYQQEFDCPPPSGVSCTSVTDLESMIVETDKGPDLFLPLYKRCDLEPACPCRKYQNAPVQRIYSALHRKVWICPHCTEEGGAVQGHYIYPSQMFDRPLINSSACNSSEEKSPIQLTTDGSGV